MNDIIERDSDSMRHFAISLKQFSTDLTSVVSDLKACCYEASDMMQDETGQEALYVLLSLAENLLKATFWANDLSDRIKKSAELIELSDTLL